jgi:hypothetical protein
LRVAVFFSVFLKCRTDFVCYCDICFCEKMRKCKIRRKAVQAQCARRYTDIESSTTRQWICALYIFTQRRCSWQSCGFACTRRPLRVHGYAHTCAHNLCKFLSVCMCMESETVRQQNVLFPVQLIWSIMDCSTHFGHDGLLTHRTSPGTARVRP